MPYRKHANPLTSIRARKMRDAPTPAEKHLWMAILEGGLGRPGPKVRRQTVILGYIIDFYQPAAQLAIEVDGHSHDSRKDADARRDAALDRKGIRTLRFTNQDVLDDVEAVLWQIRKTVADRSDFYLKSWINLP